MAEKCRQDGKTEEGMEEGARQKLMGKLETQGLCHTGTAESPVQVGGSEVR